MTTSVTIAPHLWRALEVMSQDMAVDPHALVNQAVFSWLRINGYAVAGAAPLQRTEATAAPAAPAVVPEEPLAVVAPPVPEPVPEPLLEPVASVAPPPVEEPVKVSSPKPEPEPLMEPAAVDRITEIEAARASLTKPWPAWTKPSPPEEPEESAASAEDESPALESLSSSVEEEPSEVSHPEAVQESVVAEAPAPPRPESTVVGSVGTVLYLEREGHEPVRVDADRFVIGRGLRCDFIIDSPQVSREHAVLSRAGIGYILEDLGSSNGTWFQEERVTRRELENGDVILFGNEVFTVFFRDY